MKRLVALHVTLAAIAFTLPCVAAPRELSIVDAGAVGDGATLNTEKIQFAIDQLAARGGGSLVIPKGVFLSGAIFLKPGVSLHLEKDAVLKGSTDMKNYPERRIRIEGHFEEHFNPALVNAEGCDGLRIDGEGTLDGNGRPIWDRFWELRRAAKDQRNFRNLSVPRAQLCIINNSKNVVVDGVTFKDSQYWNLHLYNCRTVLVQNARFQVPDDYKQAPSTDGIDVDSCQDVEIKGCYFSVTDDCIAMKGTWGPFAMEDKDSPPVEHVRIFDCTFKRGGGVLTLGSDATIVRDVVVENCKVIGPVNVAVLKLRSDTPQHYEDIHYRNITLNYPGGRLVAINPWKQYTDLRGQPPPKSTVRDITLSNIKGRYGAFGSIEANRGQTEISDITLENIDVQLKDGKLKAGSEVKNLKIEKVSVNGRPYRFAEAEVAPAPTLPPASITPQERKPPPTLADVAYGEHPRQVLDFWKAPSDKPTPLVFYMHGGAWVNGDKKDIGKRAFEKYLAAGISVVSISYRYTKQAQEAGVKPPVEWPLRDAARALQFVRSKAAEWNIDKRRIAASGTSAGACSSLWLALHDDMADLKSSDPVARESTRLWCAAVDSAQTSLDPAQMKEWTPNSNYGGHAFGFKGTKPRDGQFAEFLTHRDEVLPWIKEYSPIEHVSGDDPPVYLIYNSAPAIGQPQKDPTHTANFGVKLREKINSLGVECELVYPGAPDVIHASIEEFLIEKLKK